MELRLHAVTDFLNEQLWFQQAKAKWEELDPQSRGYLKVAAFAGGSLTVLLTLFSFLWSVHSLKSEVADKTEILTMIQNANEELRRLREASPVAASGSYGAEAGDAAAWPAFFEEAAGKVGVDKSALEV